MSKTGIIVQSRLNSTRFPIKALATLKGKTTVEHCLDRLRGLPFQIVVAIPNTKPNDYLEVFLKERGYEVFRGQELDVTDRFWNCAKKYNFDPIIRICSDSVLISKDEIADTLEKYNIRGKNWLAVGSGVQIFSWKALDYVMWNCVWKAEREHVWPFLEATVNYPEDIARISEYLESK